jgi:hypothetical protein
MLVRMKRGVRFGIVIGVAAGLIVFALFGAWVRIALDAEALRKSHDERVLGGMLAGTIDTVALQKKLLPFHKGAPPCAIYAEPVSPTDEELAQIVRDLRGAGLLLRIRELVTVFWLWGHTDEQRRHGPVTDEEILTSWNATGTGYEQAVAFFAGHAIAEAVRANSRAMEERETVRANAAEAALSHHEQEALQGIWMRHPTAMSIPGLLRTMSKLPRD